MKTFVLHGGRTSVDSADNSDFFKTFSSIPTEKSVRVLMCYFAWQKNDWQGGFDRDTKAIQAQSSKEISFSLASDAEDLLTKIISHDVLYVAGGQAQLIHPYVQKLAQLNKALENKVYIGSSMGAFIVATNYVLSFDDKDQVNVYNGLGILPIGVLCHWNVEEKKAEKLKKVKGDHPDLPVLTLEEKKFVTIYL